MIYLKCNIYFRKYLGIWYQAASGEPTTNSNTCVRATFGLNGKYPELAYHMHKTLHVRLNSFRITNFISLREWYRKYAMVNRRERHI